MIKYSRGKVIAFDIDEALSFEGESGPYLQYAVVRANNIFAKLKERTGLDEAAVRAAVETLPADRAQRRRRRRAVGAGARCRPARRGRRAGRAHAGVLGARQARVRARAGVQRLLPQGADPERGAAPTCAPGAPPASPTSATQLTRRAGPDGHRRAREDVMAIVGLTTCSRIADYEESLARAGADRACRSIRRSGDAAAALDGLDALVLTGGGDVDPQLLRRGAAPDVLGRRAGTRRVRVGAGAGGDGPRVAAAGDLPRRAGAQRRGRRLAGPGHRQRGARSAGPSRGRAAQHHRARSLGGVGLEPWRR